MATFHTKCSKVHENYSMMISHGDTRTESPLENALVIWLSGNADCPQIPTMTLTSAELDKLELAIRTYRARQASWQDKASKGVE